MALRSLATRMRIPAAAALRQRSGPAMAMAPAAAPSRFLGTVPNQVSDAKVKAVVREFALTTLRDARKHEEYMTLERWIKLFSRVAKVLWWTYKLGVTATVGLLVVKVANKVAEQQSDGPVC